MVYATNGIVLHQIRYSDTSVIAKIYTERHGLRSYLVRGVGGKSKKRKAGFLQPLSLVELTAKQRADGKLQTVRELKLWRPYASIHGNVLKCTVALFLAEVLYRSLKEETPNASLFSFLHQSFEAFDLADDASNFHLWFLLRLTQYFGFQPDVETNGTVNYFDLREGEFLSHIPGHPEYEENPVATAILTILGTKFAVISGLSFSSSVRQKVLDTVLRYYRMHLEGMQSVHSHEVLQTVLHD